MTHPFRYRFYCYLTLAALVVTAAAAGHSASQVSARDAFRKIQSLAGQWEGKDEQGSPVKSKFVSVASDTAVMETLSMAGMEEMVTLYSLDVDSIVLAHYCPTNNSPRMRATPTDNTKQLEFAFTGAGNLLDSNVGHEHKLVIQFIDNDHITERWTWRRNGKDTEMVYQLARVHAPANQSKEAKP